MRKKVQKTIGKFLTGKSSQKRLDNAKQSATAAFKTNSKRVIQKTGEATVDLIDKKLQKNYKGLDNFTAELFRDSYKWNRKYGIWYRNTKWKIDISRKKQAIYWYAEINIIIWL